MKILIVNTLYSPIQVGGAERSVQQIAEQLIKLGYEVTVVCLGPKDNTYLLNKVKVIALKIKNNYWPFDTIQKSSLEKMVWHFNDAYNKRYDQVFNQIFHEEKPNILFTNNLSGLSTRVWDIAREKKIKIIHTLRDYYLQCPKITKYKNGKNCQSICTSCRWLSKKKKSGSQQVDHVVGISEFILQDHINQGYFKNVSKSIIYNGFDFNTTSKSKVNSAVVFGFMGQVETIKGIELLLASFATLKQNNWKLKIAGKVDSKNQKTLQELNSSSKIEFLDYVKPTQFFNQIDVLIVPSLWNEPFGRVIIEAMLHNVPVLASNVGGIPELLKGNEPFLFEPNLGDLQSKIVNILSNPLMLSEFNFNSSFMNSFSIQKTIQNYIDIFENIQSEH